MDTNSIDLEVGTFEKDPGYTHENKTPIILDLEHNGEKIKSQLSIGISFNDFNAELFVKDQFEYHKKVLGNKIEDLKPLFFSYYEEAPHPYGNLFPPDITMSVWEDKGGRLRVFSCFREYILDAHFKQIDQNIELLNTEIEDGDKLHRSGFVQFTNKKGIRVENSVRDWIDLLGKDKNKANEYYSRFSNWNLFRNFDRDKDFIKPLRRNPLLVISYKAFKSYFSQPTVQDKFPNWDKVIILGKK